MDGLNFARLSGRIQDEIDHNENRAVNCQRMIDDKWLSEESKIRIAGKKEAFMIVAQELRAMLRDMGEL